MDQAVEPDEVRVFVLALADANLDPARCAAVLSPEELAYAQRFRRPEDARNRLAAWLLARVALGELTQSPPRDLEFSRVCRYCGKLHGKPRLTGRWAGSFDFNLSHSKNVVALAVSQTREVGIDVEFVRNNVRWDAVAPTVFGADADAWLEKHAGPERPVAFFKAWVDREARAKATGLGLPGISATDVSGLTSTAIAVEPGYVGAVASSGGAFTVRQIAAAALLQQGLLLVEE